MINIALIGNCQSTAISKALLRSNLVTVKYVLDINCISTEEFQKSKHSLLKNKDIDCIITQNLSDNFDDLSTDNLKSIFKEKILTLTNIYFTGLHPDLSYFGSFGNRFFSPLGDYHSKIALMCFSKQIKKEECIELFTDDIYRKLYYFDSYKNSKIELLKRDENLDIKFASDFFDITNDHLSLYAVNHPTPIVVKKLVIKILSHLNLETKEVDNYFEDVFIKSQIWPLYESIRDFNNLQYCTPQYYSPSIESNLKKMHREEFINRSYDEYEKIGYLKFMQVPLAEVLKNISI